MNFEDLQFPESWQRWRDYYLPDDMTARWFTALAVFLVAVAVISIVLKVLTRQASRLAARTTSVWDDAAVDALRETRTWFIVAVAAFCGSLMLGLPARTQEVLQVIIVLVLLLQAGFWGNSLIGAAVRRYTEQKSVADPAAAMTLSALAVLGKILLFVVLVLLALDNLGVDITALIAGLGIGGIAVALAVQNILGDLLASLSIVFDKPFVPGDFITVGDKMGTVQSIGLKTTRLTSLSGEQLVFSNNDLLQSRIQNYKRMRERRVVFAIGVTYETPRSLLTTIPQVLREAVEQQEETRFDRAHFKSFGDFSLNFEVVYYVLTPDFARYMDIQQAINLAIHERFETLGVEFAYPTQLLYVKQEGGPGLVPRGA
ncbi:mechanosensitive ion channel family protein [Candidatus Laterigemmans baculatus]|uniref:mechanosensitive ion channel family protein n=1 Tax=Candidatus Laterigemmans baculatus TaxID=2770505 RepID=UPI00193BDC44|nr:mechanosensitive ion channel family protein [Candidatus Laterigemmans baculatus]